MKKMLLAAAALSATYAATPAMADGHDCGGVSITEMSWQSGAVVTAVAEFIMRHGYGCEVTVVPTSTVPAVTSVAENNEPDIVTELWVNSAPLFNKLEAEGKIKKVADVFIGGGKEAWWIPATLAEQHPELTTIEGIIDNPELVGGRFHNCPPGWACKIINDSMIDVYGMEGKIEIFNHGSGETLAASLAAAMENGDPWFGYYWSPTLVMGKYEMAEVDVGSVDFEVFQCNADPNCADKGRSAYPPSSVITAVTTDFAERNPPIDALMSKMSFPIDVLSRVMAWQDANRASVSEAAAYFLANNRDVWGSWLNDEAAKKLGFRR